MEMLARVTRAFWILVIGVIGLYGFFLVMGALSPADQPWLTLAVVVLATLLLVHLVRVRHAMHEPGHEAEMRELHKMRERRGF